MEHKQSHEQRSHIAVWLLIGLMLVTTAHGKPTENEPASQQLQVKQNTKEREILENREQQVKLIKNKDSNGQFTSLIGFDYAESLVLLYVPKKEACVLIGGIMEEVGSFDDDPNIDITLTSKVPNRGSGGAMMKYVVNQVHPVTSTRLLTKVLSTSLNCNGTNTYWAQRNDALNIADGTDTEAQGSHVTTVSHLRKKRGAGWFFIVLQFIMPYLFD